jgi:hypothetical protein
MRPLRRLARRTATADVRDPDLEDPQLSPARALRELVASGRGPSNAGVRRIDPVTRPLGAAVVQEPVDERRPARRRRRPGPTR